MKNKGFNNDNKNNKDQEKQCSSLPAIVKIQPKFVNFNHRIKQIFFKNRNHYKTFKKDVILII